MGIKKQIVYKKIDEIHPYANNPRFNDDAVKYVANSIKEFGFQNPMIIKSDGEIICGHTRYKAALELGLKEVPCIVADDLTDEQIKAFRIIDNKTNDMASWNDDLLGLEMKDLLGEFDMTDYGFGDFEISMLTEDMEPEDYDGDLIKEYSNNSDNFLINKRVIITYKTEEQEKWLKELLKEENEELKVVYTANELMERINNE